MSLVRRDFLTTSTAVASGTLVGCTRPPAPEATNVMFAVPASYIPVVGSRKVFQVRRIYCVGHNYAAHAREMGADPARDPPFFFQKPTDAIQLVPQGVTVDHSYPSMTKNYHHEVELVAAIGKGG